MLTLKQYIDSIGGSAQLAKLLKRSRQQTNMWAQGHEAPTPKIAAQIIILSQGALDFNSIYAPFIARKYKGKKFKLKSLSGADVSFKF